MEAVAEARLARLFAGSRYSQAVWPMDASSFPGPSRARPVGGLFGFPAPARASHLLESRSAFSGLPTFTSVGSTAVNQGSPLAVKTESMEVDLSEPISGSVPGAMSSVEEGTLVPVKRSRSLAPPPELWHGFSATNCPRRAPSQDSVSGTSEAPLPAPACSCSPGWCWRPVLGGDWPAGASRASASSRETPSRSPAQPPS